MESPETRILRTQLHKLSHQKSEILREKDLHAGQIQLYDKETKMLLKLKTRWEKKLESIKSLEDFFGKEIYIENQESPKEIIERLFRLLSEIAGGSITNGNDVLTKIKGRVSKQQRMNK